MLFNVAVNERLLRTKEDFIWSAEFAYHGCFTIEVEFLDLKICPTNVSPLKLEAVTSLKEIILLF